MKTFSFQFILKCVVIALVLCPLVGLTQVNENRFTLQGKLELSGQVASGSHDFFVYVYDAETGGNLLGSQLVQAVNVDQGEFSLVVDAGDVFSTNPVWLEIAAGPAGGALTTLSGRTAVHAAPRSQYAEMAAKVADGSVTTAKLADGSVTAAKIQSGQVGTAQLADTGVTTAKLADASVTAAKIQSGQVGTAQLADTGVTTAKLADTSVTAAKVDKTQIQLRVSGQCGDGMAVGQIYDSGLVACNPIRPGSFNMATVTLPGGGGDYTSLNAAVSDLAGWCNDSNEACVIQISAGIYNLPDSLITITTAGTGRGLIIRGAGRSATRLYADNMTTTRLISSNTMLTLENLFLSYSGPAGIQAMFDTTERVNLTNVTLVMGLTGIPSASEMNMFNVQATNGDTLMTVRDSNLEIWPNTDNYSGAGIEVNLIKLPNEMALEIHGSRLYFENTYAPTIVDASILRLSTYRTGIWDTRLQMTGDYGIGLNHVRTVSSTELELWQVDLEAGQGISMVDAYLYIHQSRIGGRTAALSVTTSSVPSQDVETSKLVHSYFYTQTASSVMNFGSQGATNRPVYLLHSVLMPGGSTPATLEVGTAYTLTCMDVTASVNGTLDIYGNTCPP